MTQRVFGFHYKLTLKEDGTEIDSSFGEEPLLFLEGSQQIIPGLEDEIIKMNKGDKNTINVAAKDAYGEVQEELQVSVKTSQFPNNGADLNVGDQFQVNEDPNAPIFTVVEIEGEDVHVDGNHPLAGRDLVFEVEVTEVRDATDEEKAHGHAHGPGGHQH